MLENSLESGGWAARFGRRAASKQIKGNGGGVKLKCKNPFRGPWNPAYDRFTPRTRPYTRVHTTEDVKATNNNEIGTETRTGLRRHKEFASIAC